MVKSTFSRLIDSSTLKWTLAIIAFVGLGLGLYTAFFQKKKAELQYQVIANTNVLDFNADVSKLEVIYDSTNLKQTKENLRIYTVRIINNGNEDITKSFYDNTDPIGIGISSGKIIEKPQLIEASNNYLNNHLKIENFQFNKVSLSQVILEPGEYFIIKLLVLHNKNSIPNILSLGKVAGQKAIKVIDSINNKKDEGFYYTVYHGNLDVQSLRAISYFMFVLILIIITAFITSRIGDLSSKLQRKAIIRDFKKSKDYHDIRLHDIIFDIYKNNGNAHFTQMNRLLNDEEQLNNTYLTEKEKSTALNSSFRVTTLTEYEPTISSSTDILVIYDMLKVGLISFSQKKLVVNKPMQQFLDKFNSYIVSLSYKDL